MEDKPKNETDLTMILTEYMGDNVFARRFARCITMLRSKNADYSQGEQKGDRIAAFRRIAKDIDLPITKAWAVLCQKHWGAVMKFVKSGILESEPIDGRIDDIINYMVLLGAIIDDMGESDVTSSPIQPSVRRLSANHAESSDTEQILKDADDEIPF